MRMRDHLNVHRRGATREAAVLGSCRSGWLRLSPNSERDRTSLARNLPRVQPPGTTQVEKRRLQSRYPVWLNEARDPVLRKSPVSSRARHVGCPLKGAESTTRDRHRRERGPRHHRGVSAIVQIITKHSSQKKQRKRAFFQRRCCQDTAVET